jgi:hypothetical protein
MIGPRVKLILGAMIAMAFAFGVLLFVDPNGRRGAPGVNAGLHPPVQTPVQ